MTPEVTHLVRVGARVPHVTAVTSVLLALVALLVVVVPSRAGAADALDAPSSPANPAPVTTSTAQFAKVDGVALLADAYLPDTTGADRPVIVLVHGGGWTGGDRRSFGDEARWLAERGYVTFSVDYRLAPDHRFPAAVDDVRTFVRWLRDPKQVAKYRIDPARIGALGSSAGGHLAAMLGTVGRGSPTRGSRVNAVVSWSGPMDLADEHAVAGSEAVTTFLGCEPAGSVRCTKRARIASPVTFVDRTDAPTLLFTSDAEIVSLAQAEVMDTALTRAGVEHDLVVYPGDVHAQWYRVEAWPLTVAFFEQYLGTPSR